jgi:hypothetical protein
VKNLPPLGIQRWNLKVKGGTSELFRNLHSNISLPVFVAFDFAVAISESFMRRRKQQTTFYDESFLAFIVCSAVSLPTQLELWMDLYKTRRRMCV